MAPKLVAAVQDTGISGKDVAKYVGVAAAGAAVGFLIGRYYFRTRGFVNLSVDKHNSKVVHTVPIEEIGDKKYFCRCWRSKNFPYCDGSHSKHNEATGDNVGPLCVAKKA